MKTALYCPGETIIISEVIHFTRLSVNKLLIGKNVKISGNGSCLILPRTQSHKLHVHEVSFSVYEEGDNKCFGL